MTRVRIRIHDVLLHLGADETGILEDLRREGLFPLDELEPHEAEELRVALLLSEELGVNAAGVDVALHLRRRLIALEGRARTLARALEAEDLPADMIGSED